MQTVYNNTHNTCKNESKHSEMGPVRQNPIQRTVSLFICVCIALCTIVAHNIAQNRPESFPPCPPDDHHSSDDVYLREGGMGNTTYITIKMLQNTYWWIRLGVKCSGGSHGSSSIVTGRHRRHLKRVASDAGLIAARRTLQIAGSVWHSGRAWWSARLQALVYWHPGNIE